MFFNEPGNPSKFKKAVYLFATTIMGILLSFVIHAFIEINYLSWVENQGYAPVFYGHCALHPALQAGLLILGAVGGFFLGRFWWRKIYIERVWMAKR
jgi:hypothetical protein